MMCTVTYCGVKCVLHRGYLLEYVREYIVTSSYLYCIQTSNWFVWINGCVLVHLFNYFHHTIKLVRSNTIDCLRLSNICLSWKENNPQPQRHALWWQQVVLFSCLPHSQKLEGWPQPHRQPMDSLNGNGVDAVESRWLDEILYGSLNALVAARPTAESRRCSLLSITIRAQRVSYAVSSSIFEKVL